MRYGVLKAGAPVAVGVTLAALVALPVAASAASATGTVVVVHGLRGVVADVSVDGKVVLRGFSPSRITSPLPLLAGTHTLSVRRSGCAAGSPPLITKIVTISAGSASAVVAGLSSTGTPDLSVFDNKPSTFGIPSSGLIVRSVAAAPTAKAVLDGKAASGTLASAGQLAVPSQAGPHELALQATGTGATLIAPQNAPVTAGTATVVYLTGSAQNSTLGWLAQTVRMPAASVAPRTVKTGNSGLAAQPAASGGVVDGLSATGSAGILTLAAVGLWLVRRRRGQRLTRCQ
jgi:hypothetical protein